MDEKEFNALPVEEQYRLMKSGAVRPDEKVYKSLALKESYAAAERDVAKNPRLHIGRTQRGYYRQYSENYSRQYVVDSNRYLGRDVVTPQARPQEAKPLLNVQPSNLFGTGTEQYQAPKERIITNKGYRPTAPQPSNTPRSSISQNQLMGTQEERRPPTEEEIKASSNGQVSYVDAYGRPRSALVAQEDTVTADRREYDRRVLEVARGYGYPTEPYAGGMSTPGRRVFSELAMRRLQNEAVGVVSSTEAKQKKTTEGLIKKYGTAGAANILTGAQTVETQEEADTISRDYNPTRRDIKTVKTFSSLSQSKSNIIDKAYKDFENKSASLESIQDKRYIKEYVPRREALKASARDYATLNYEGLKNDEQGREFLKGLTKNQSFASKVIETTDDGIQAINRKINESGVISKTLDSKYNIGMYPIRGLQKVPVVGGIVKGIENDLRYRPYGTAVEVAGSYGAGKIIGYISKTGASRYAKQAAEGVKFGATKLGIVKGTGLGVGALGVGSITVGAYMAPKGKRSEYIGEQIPALAAGVLGGVRGIKAADTYITSRGGVPAWSSSEYVAGLANKQLRGTNIIGSERYTGETKTEIDYATVKTRVPGFRLGTRPKEISGELYQAYTPIKFFKLGGKTQYTAGEPVLVKNVYSPVSFAPAGKTENVMPALEYTVGKGQGSKVYSPSRGLSFFSRDGQQSIIQRLKVGSNRYNIITRSDVKTGKSTVEVFNKKGIMGSFSAQGEAPAMRTENIIKPQYSKGDTKKLVFGYGRGINAKILTRTRRFRTVDIPEGMEATTMQFITSEGGTVRPVEIGRVNNPSKVILSKSTKREPRFINQVQDNNVLTVDRPAFTNVKNEVAMSRKFIIEFVDTPQAKASRFSTRWGKKAQKAITSRQQVYETIKESGRAGESNINIQAVKPIMSSASSSIPFVMPVSLTTSITEPTRVPRQSSSREGSFNGIRGIIAPPIVEEKRYIAPAPIVTPAPPITEVITRPDITPRQKTRTAVITANVTVPETRAPRIPSPGYPGVPTIRLPEPPIVPPVIKFPPPMGFPSFGGISRIKSPKRGYTPSLQAVAFGITGKASRSAINTGFGFRPLGGSAPRVKRKKGKRNKARFIV